MKTTLAALTTGAMLFGFTSLAFAAATEAPGGGSDITIVESTPGEKGNPATSAPAPAAAHDVHPDETGNEGVENKGNRQAE